VKLILLILSLSAFANDGTNLLLNSKGEDIDLSSKLTQVKQLNLDDAFKVQLFGKWKAAGAVDPAVNDWVNLVLAGEFDKSLSSLPQALKLAPIKFRATLNTAKLYLFSKLNLHSLFVSEWINAASDSQFLNSELGLALDFVVSSNLTQNLISSGVFFSNSEKKALKAIENKQSQINYILQGFNSLRSGKDALQWISKLNVNNPLRLIIANTALIDYAKDGSLKASARLIKEVVEPIIKKSDDVESISHYYLNLARLLYQAKAYEAARGYYESIPESSRYFLTASTELIWTNLRLKDYPAVKGALATLKLNLFEDKFNPEIYLVSSIANLHTCQFSEVRDNFKVFLSANKKWAKLIDEELSKEDAKTIEEDFFTINLSRYVKEAVSEKEYLAKLENSFWTPNINSISENTSLALIISKAESKRRWKNRETILSESIYKMRFVKIEFISQMRDFSLKLAKSYEDKVSTYAAATARDNQLSFKADRVIWSDELFNTTAQVENLCMQGRK